MIYGQGGNDLLFGGAGDNFLDAGADFMVGEGGSDVFLFRGAYTGSDSIGDFVSGFDSLWFDDATGLNNSQDVFDGMSQQGGNTLIYFGNGSSLLLYDVDMNTLDSGDFAFL